MNRYSRNLVLDIFDYQGRRLCNLYDNSFDISGQATDVYVQTERNGWKELSFSQPSVCETENGSEPNFRLQYLKADYRIRLIDDHEMDWYIISEPKITHQAFSKNVSVVAGHVSQMLKTKNLDLEFSDDEGNNVGTAAQLLDTILQGTGWKAGDVCTFYEKDETTAKVRSLKASAKTGAFKLITQMCDLFDAKPVFHGNTKTVDILPMNPFSKPVDGELPDIVDTNKVLELHYGQNVSGITRVLNTDNLVTKLYAHGSYGDVDLGYCGIDVAEHTEYEYTVTKQLEPGVQYVFVPGNHTSRVFTPKYRVSVGEKLYWSDLDPASMSYIWDDDNHHAYQVFDGDITYYVDENGQLLIDPSSTSLSSNTVQPASCIETKKKNWFSFIMDFSYYQNVGLMTDDMLQKLALYQREGLKLYEESYDASVSLNELLNKLVLELIGSSNYCKLNIASTGDANGYTQIILDADSPVLYRTDYYENIKNRFKWTPAESIDEKGDPFNGTASILYVIHPTAPTTWDKYYIQDFNGALHDAQDGKEQENITTMTLWATDANIGTDDDVYLFEMVDASAVIGSREVSDESAVQALDNLTKVVTTKHPVYFADIHDAEPPIKQSEINGYAWLWQFDFTGEQPSKMYFYMAYPGSTGDADSEEWYTQSWTQVYFDATPPALGSFNGSAFWYNWRDLKDYTQSTLYAWKDQTWQPATSKIINAQWEETPNVQGDANEYSSAVYKIEDLYATFKAVRQQCLTRDILYQGRGEYLVYNVVGEELPAGSYYMEDSFHQSYVFTTTEDLVPGSRLKYKFTGDSYRYVEQYALVDGNEIKTVLEAKDWPMDAVGYNNDKKDIIIVDKTEHYTRLEPVEYEGENTGLISLMRRFQEVSDEAYEERLATYQQAQNKIAELQEDTVEALGDIYREGWWQSDEYVEGDEEKLYQDAMDNLIEIAQPEATYTVNYLDRYGANTGMEFGASDMTQGLDYPDVTIDYAVHLVDPEIDINIWAFIDKLRKCYDKPWNTSLTINTNLSTMTQHTFTDVLAHIADVASQLKGKASTYERAGFISADGTLAAERLQGAIDAAKIKIFGGGSTWYTDESGNMVFESADGSSAMTLAGGGFALADSKNEWGEWNWRSFGSGHGFSADELITGFLSADRIQANSIGSHKLDSNTQALLGWVEGSRMEFGDESITATVAKELSTGDSDAAVQYRAAMAKLTAEDYTIYFEEKSAELDKKIAAMQKTTDYINNWYQFKSDGFYIRGKQADGSASPMYTQQTNSSYTFYNDGEKVASMSVNGFSAPKVEAESEFRLGNLVAIVDDNNDITWVYSKKSTTN